MLTVGYFESFKMNAPVPEWAKAERYDYCDQTSTRKDDFLHFLSEFFTHLLR